ncbi:MAG TPA: DNA primase [Erysipelothrix sp.]
MRRIPESLINEIRAKTDIVDYIGQYVSLVQKGKNYWGICPFHDDNNPSMSVASDKQIFKCFVCGEGGNVFQFAQDYHKINFVEAVNQLGALSGFDMSNYAYEEKQVDPEIAKYREIMAEANQFVQFQLNTEAANQARQVLEKRGYPEALLKHFEVGVALSSQSLTDFMLAKGYDEQDLIRLNLARFQDDKVQDVFFDRIMFPIADASGNTIAFSARAIEKQHPIKYINSSETPLYTKGEILYNYHRAKNAAKEKQAIIVCEGVTDVFAFYQAGIENVVSYLGVAGTDEQIRKTMHLSRNVILAFDGDKAGSNASYKIGKKFIEKGAQVAIWYNDTGQDPDDLFREQGAKPLEQGLRDKIAWLDYILYFGLSLYDISSFDNKKKYASFVIKHLRDEDDLTKEYYLRQVAKRTDLNQDMLQGYLHHEPTTPSRTVIVPQQKQLMISHAEQSILKQMLNSKAAAYRFRDQLGFLIDDTAQETALVILDHYRQFDELVIADLLSKKLDTQVEQLILDLIDNDVLDAFDEKVFDEYCEDIKVKFNQRGLKHLQNEVNLTVTKDDKVNLLLQAINKKREGER